MSGGKPAARIGDEISHTSALTGFLAGAAVGLAVGAVIVAATVATGGAALAVVAAAGAAAASTGGMAMVGGAFGATFSAPSGAIAPVCSLNVLINQRPAARAVLDFALCSNHAPGPPKSIATGAMWVMINSQPAARIDEMTVCGAKISSGSQNVLIGGPSGQMLPIASEIPEWMMTAAKVLVIGGTIVAIGAGAAAAFMAGGTCALITFAGTTAGEMLLGAAGSEVGGAIGEYLGGERGRIIGETLGGIAGGFAGGKLGGRMARGHPVDVATGELFTSAEDFTLPGPVPLVFRRVWMSSSSETGRTGGLGWKWHHPLAVRLVRKDGQFIARLEDGRIALFRTPEPGKPSLNIPESLLLETVEGQYRLRDFGGRCWLFQPAAAQPDLWLLGAITDQNGNRIALGHDEADRLTEIVDSGGRRLVVDNDDAGRIVAIRIATGAKGQAAWLPLVRYAYTPEGDLAEALDATDQGWSYAYADHLLTSERKPAGMSFLFRWSAGTADAGPRCIETWGRSASGAYDRLHYARFVHQPLRRETRVYDAAEQETLYCDDGLGRVRYMRGPDGVETWYARDVAGHLLETRNSLGQTARNAYDRLGRLTRRSNFAGVAETLSYASDDLNSLQVGLVGVVQHAERGTHRLDYDNRGNVTVMVDPTGRRVHMLRDARGFPLASQDRLGVIWRWQWAANGDLQAEGPGAPRRFYAYDTLGRVVELRNATGGTMRLGYDAAGRLVEQNLGDGRAVRMARDAEGRMIRHVDPQGATTVFDYDGLRYPVRETRPDGTVLTFGYDFEQRPKTIVNARGERHEWVYDAMGALIRETGFDGRETRFESDRFGFLASTVEGGERTRYKRDERGRIVAKLFEDGSTHHFEWAPCGEIARAATPDATVERRYDEAGRLVAERQGDYEIAYEFDERGRRLRTVLPDGRAVAFRYDDASDLAAIRFGERDICQFGRDADGRITGRMQRGSALEQAFDPQGRMLRQRLSTRAGDSRSTLVQRDYSYDPLDNLAQISDSLRGVTGYRYDALQRLTAAEGWSPERFTYDAADNLVDVAQAAAPARPEALPQAFGNRVSVMGDRHITYDQRGNVVQMVAGAGGHTRSEFSYGGNHMLTSMVRRDRHGLTEARYGYDAFNRRVFKRVETTPGADNDAAPAVSATTTFWLWDGDLPLAEWQEGEPTFSSIYLFEPTTFRPVALLRGEEGTAYHYVNDALGTPQELVDETGRIAWSARYRVFGAAAVTQGQDLAQPLRFPGQYFDAESGLHYNRNRYYDPQIGRYTQPDPSFLLGGLNLFGYPANPTRLIDPLGLVPLDQGGYSVYHIINKRTGEVAYVGITNNPDVRQGQHMDSGRLGRGYRMEVQERNLSYAQARGYEQADIQRFGTRDTSRIGEPMRAGEPNRVWSYDPARVNNPHDARAQAFDEHYRERMAQHGGCG